MKKFVSICLLLFIVIFANAQKESFDKFIIRFIEDSVFQSRRVSYPFPCVTWDYEKDTQYTFYIDKGQWKYDKLFYTDDMDAYYIFYDNFDCKFTDSDEMVFRWKGVTDMDVKYFFKRINSLWYLIKLEDYDMEIP